MRGIGTSHKHLKGLIKKYGITLLVISEPFLKEEAICHYEQAFGLMKFFSNQATDGKVWILWCENLDFEVVNISNQLIKSWFLCNGIKMPISIMYAKCSYYERKGL